MVPPIPCKAIANSSLTRLTQLDLLNKREIMPGIRNVGNYGANGIRILEEKL